MTSDAKIGLLLGLVFIFIIAFIINGWHFGGQEDNNDLTQNMVTLQRQPAAIGDRERTAAREINSPNTHVTQPPAVQPQAPTARREVSRQMREVRTTMPLPRLPETMVAESSQEIGKEKHYQRTAFHESTESPESKARSSSVSIPDAAADRQIDPEKPRGTKTNADAIQENQKPGDKPESIRVIKPRTSGWPKMYVVQEGDSLWTIARKFYGPARGTKETAMKKIMERNSGKIKSAARIYPGQRLFIPRPTSEPTSDTLGTSRFEQVESVGRRHIARKSRVATGYRTYVVKEGDSLWSIAAAQLGSGSRYKQIKKMNPDKIKNEDTVLAGTTIKLPKE